MFNHRFSPYSQYSTFSELTLYYIILNFATIFLIFLKNCILCRKTGIFVALDFIMLYNEIKEMTLWIELL